MWIHGARSNHRREESSERTVIISTTRTGSLGGRIKAIIKMSSGKRAGCISRSQSRGFLVTLWVMICRWKWHLLWAAIKNCPGKSGKWTANKATLKQQCGFWPLSWSKMYLLGSWSIFPQNIGEESFGLLCVWASAELTLGMTSQISYSAVEAQVWESKGQLRRWQSRTESFDLFGKNSCWCLKCQMFSF